MEEEEEGGADKGEEAGLPDAKSWGKRKKEYYNTDYVDDDMPGKTLVLQGPLLWRKLTPVPNCRNIHGFKQKLLKTFFKITSTGYFVWHA